MKSDKDQVRSYDIKLALKSMHEKRSTYFITECKTCSTYFPDPQGLLIFDGLAITKSYTRPCITGYEIKVSRSDFLQDGKWHLYLQYCNEFFFVVPKGLIKKDELPENVGLIYYNPETKVLRTAKKALYREIEEPVGIYKYIIFSRLEEDRLPFYENREEYARDYLADKYEKRLLGKAFGSKMARELAEVQERLDSLGRAASKMETLEQLKQTMKKYGVGNYCWRDEGLAEELDKALQRDYPEKLDVVRSNLQNAIDCLDIIKKQCTGTLQEV